MKKPPLQDVIVRSSSRTPRASSRQTPPPAQDVPEPLQRVAPPRSEASSSRVEGFRVVRDPVREIREDESELGETFSQEGGKSSWEDLPPVQRRSGGVEGAVRYRKAPHPWFKLSLLGFVVVVFSFLAFSFIFAGATVVVYPKQDTVTVNTTFVAQQGDVLPEGVVPFTTVSKEETFKVSVPAKGEEKVSERASGTITLYNKQSTTPQRLIKNTRFEAQDGHIFRIRESVEIPGKKADGTPGSVDVVVYAEEVGDAYNIQAGKLTIPGFKGLPQADTIYAQAQAPMKGGFSGTRRIVDPADRAKALEELQKKAQQTLVEALQKEDSGTDKNTLFFKDAVFVSIAPLPDEPVDDKTVSIAVQGRVEGVVFEKAVLAQRLAKDAVSGYTGSPIHIEDGKDLIVHVERIAPQSVSASSSASTLASVSVSIQGKARFVWDFDAVQFAKDIAGKDLSSVSTGRTNALLGAYPGIDRVQTSIRPFWKRTFPTNIKEITVRTKLDAEPIF